MATRTNLLTVETFWKQYADMPYELIEGEVVEVTPAGNLHGLIASRVIAQLRYFVDENNLGEVYSSETGFQLSPNTMRGADAAFIKKDKLSRITEPEKFVPFAPDLAVEVVSPGDKASEIQTKVELYLAAGTSIVWVIFPDIKKVVVYQNNHKSETLSLEDTLDGNIVLPGLNIPVRKLFPPEENK